MPVTRLQKLNLTEASFRRLGTRQAWAHVTLRTYDLTPALRKIPPFRRHGYIIARMNRWITTWYRDFPRLLFAAVDGRLIRGGIADRADLPNALRVRGPARDLVALQARWESALFVSRSRGLSSESRNNFSILLELRPSSRRNSRREAKIGPSNH